MTTLIINNPTPNNHNPHHTNYIPNCPHCDRPLTLRFEFYSYNPTTNANEPNNFFYTCENHQEIYIPLT